MWLVAFSSNSRSPNTCRRGRPASCRRRGRSRPAARRRGPPPSGAARARRRGSPRTDSTRPAAKRSSSPSTLTAARQVERPGRAHDAVHAAEVRRGEDLLRRHVDDHGAPHAVGALRRHPARAGGEPDGQVGAAAAEAHRGERRARAAPRRARSSRRDVLPPRRLGIRRVEAQQRRDQRPQALHVGLAEHRLGPCRGTVRARPSRPPRRARSRPTGRRVCGRWSRAEPRTGSMSSSRSGHGSPHTCDQRPTRRSTDSAVTASSQSGTKPRQSSGAWRRRERLTCWSQ